MDSASQSETYKQRFVASPTEYSPEELLGSALVGQSDLVGSLVYTVFVFWRCWFQCVCWPFEVTVIVFVGYVKVQLYCGFLLFEGAVGVCTM